MYSFIACSQKLGTVKVTMGPNTRVITMYGVWVPDEEAEYYVSQTYPVFCPVKKQFEQRHAVFYVTPTADQLRLKPEGGI